MLKLISGALIGSVNYKEIYMESDIGDKTNNMAELQKTKVLKIPTLLETARKVARLEKEN